MDGFSNRHNGRVTSFSSDNSEHPTHGRFAPAPVSIGHRQSRRKDSIQHPKPPLTPNTSTMPQPIPNPLLPSAPASPPTPAPSPTPHQRSPTTWRLSNLEDSDEPLPVLEDARRLFMRLSVSARENWLRSLVDTCDNHTLSFLHQTVSPRLKKDPFKALPNELCWKVCFPVREDSSQTDKDSSDSRIRRRSENICSCFIGVQEMA